MSDEPSLLSEFMKAQRELASHRYGFDKLSDDKITGAALSIVSALPKERLRTHLTKISASGGALDRLRAKQLSFLLFVIDELEKSYRELSQEDAACVLVDMLAPNR